MHLMDYHTHSNCSPDGNDPMTQLAGAAVKAGLCELAITDHFDLDEIDGTAGSGQYDAGRIRAEFDAARAQYEGKLRLVYGVEFGEALHALPRAERILSENEFDFVIGSVHNLGGVADFYSLEYNNLEECYGYLDLYMDELMDMSKWDGFDSLGHLTYPLRYMVARGMTKVDFTRYEEKLRAIFKSLAQNGRGMEVNTSGLRGSLKDTLPPLWCLRLFKQCGGEIVTVGSDSHTTRDIGAGIREGYAALEAAGFRYVAAFEKRRPVFHDLS